MKLAGESEKIEIEIHGVCETRREVHVQRSGREFLMSSHWVQRGVMGHGLSFVFLSSSRASKCWC